jgi:type III restriction enzyme
MSVNPALGSEPSATLKIDRYLFLSNHENERSSGMFRELEYQTRVFAALDHYLEALAKQKANADQVAKLAAEKSGLSIPVPDFTKDAWDKMQSAGHLPVSRDNIPFSRRKDGIGNPVPNATLKVPTGGGKTWLAVKAASKILNKYLGQNTGFILWIVPNEAIYSQTLRHFKDRAHSYRLALDRAAAGKVKILTKSDRLHVMDVETHLCVMVLMLQSSNRQNKNTLRMFRDRGDVHGFVPGDAQQDAHRAMLERTPNLDAYQGFLPQVKSSLGNALRIIRPVVVMDEGHKAISELAYKTLYGFNPSFVLELTATPRDVAGRKSPSENRYANLLVEVTGRDLDREGMIKMPLVLDPFEAGDWQTVLAASVERLNALQNEATAYGAESDRYIRPILLVQVERTGKDQRDGGHIHAEDVRDRLLQIGFDEAEIALKTAEQNDLAKPENKELLSPYNRVRVIITKEALQEGWDCPFAYVLCALAARTDQSAMTQLVGRILRQPHAEKTDIIELNQCYVFTHQSTTQTVVGQIKSGLEKDGLADLVLSVTTDAGQSRMMNPHKIQRRASFQQTQIYLPHVLINCDGVMRPLDYETDILTHIEWTGFNHDEVVRAIGPRTPKRDRQLAVIRTADEEGITHDYTARIEDFVTFDPVHVVRQISDVVLNPFVAWHLVSRLVDELIAAGVEEMTMGFRSEEIIASLRRELIKEQDKRAEAFFRQAVHDGVIQFRLRADGNNWMMPQDIITNGGDNAHQLVNEAGDPMQRSLFERVYQIELNSAERDVAVYLDEHETVGWWHRNVARRDYGLKGWKKNIIYPDLIFSVEDGGKTAKLVAVETKGEFLDGTEDTEYKRVLMDFLTKNFDWDSTQPVGQMELQQSGVRVHCDLILLDGWATVFEEKYFG